MIMRFILMMPMMMMINDEVHSDDAYDEDVVAVDDDHCGCSLPSVISAPSSTQPAFALCSANLGIVVDVFNNSSTTLKTS